MVLGILVFAAVTGGYLYIKVKGYQRATDSVVQNFHARLDEGRLTDLLSDTTADFQNSDKRENLLKYFETIHSKLGRSKSCKRVRGEFNANTRGENTVTVNYECDFEKGKAAEAFTLVATEAGVKIQNYRIDSKALSGL